MFRFLEGTRGLPLHIRAFSSFDQDFISIGSFRRFLSTPIHFSGVGLQERFEKSIEIQRIRNLPPSHGENWKSKGSELFVW